MNYYEFKESAVNCPSCHWEGIGRNTEQGQMFEDLYEYHCPSCGEKIGVRLYPTTQEARECWDKVSPLERQFIEMVAESQQQFSELSLKSAEQLPDLGDSPLVITWDLERDGNEMRWTSLRYGAQTIWKEPACWEGYWRFGEIASLLREKYGSQLTDVVPTPRSEMYLYGEKSSALDTVKLVRASLWPSIKRKHD